MRNAEHPRRRAAYRARFGTDDPGEVAEYWRAAWEEHHRRVLAEIPGGSLLVFDIESDPRSGSATSSACRAHARACTRLKIPG